MLKANKQARGTLATQWVVCALGVAMMSMGLAAPAADATESKETPSLKVAALRFGVTPDVGAGTSSRTRDKVGAVHGPLKTTVMLLEDDDTRVCVITTDFINLSPWVNKLYRERTAEVLGIDPSHVVFFNSHNHSDANLAGSERSGDPEAGLLPLGQQELDNILDCARKLPDMLKPVHVWWGQGHEDRISYNRKGRRADGTTFLMREEDRVEWGEDFNGDIDTQAPVVLFKDMNHEPVTALLQFTAHPVTCYDPEEPVVYGDWPQVTTDLVAAKLGEQSQNAVVAGFMQGCAGDVNSKEMFWGDVQRSREFGWMLAETYIETLDDLQQSERDGLDFEVVEAAIPLAPLPSPEILEAELAEMDDFIKRAHAGDEETLHCVGLNFPRDLTPAYRARLVEAIKPWNEWALGLHKEGKADTVPEHLNVNVYVLRIGDVAIVGMPCEPFQGIGRIIREKSPYPLSIPCGYTNISRGYITDGPNTGDKEYMSAQYRYTGKRPPFKAPAGEVMAERAVEVLEGFYGKSE